MDRKYRQPDLVHVYATQLARNARQVHDKFSARAYSDGGFDNYLYAGIMYPGYQDRDTGEVYIILTNPLFKGTKP